jgi:peroxiredoxin
MQQFSILLLLFLISSGLIAQNSVISGKSIDYSEKVITFYTVPDPVLHQRLELATTKVVNDGTFSVTLPVNQTIVIYTDLEKYCGTMVVEPGKNYQVTLPPFSLRTTNEARSPYFKPAPYWLGLPATENTDINFSVRSFVTDFNFETIKNTVPIYQNKSIEVVNEIIARLEQKYSVNQDEFFKILKKYYFAELEYTVHQRNPEFVILKYFAKMPLRLSHPAYQRAFETIFTDFLRKQSQDIKNQNIIINTNAGNFLNLVTFFESKGYSKEFAELVVLKGLNDGYYTGSFSKNGVMSAIEMAQSETSSPVLQPIARQIKIKLAQMAVGGKAPMLKLLNQKNETVTLDLYSGKFVYLLFFNSKSADCKTELDSLVSIEKRLRQVLGVISVSVEDDFENAARLWKEKRYSWELLNGSKQKQLILNYKAYITPVFYLINPLGKIQLSPAPAPSQGFEPLFIKIFRDYH